MSSEDTKQAPDDIVDVATALRNTYENRKRIALKPSINKPSRLCATNNTHENSFGQSEVESLLTTIEVYLPLCREGWNKVLKVQDRLFTSSSRTVEGIRRKFASINRKRVPKGDVLIPADMKRAKYIRFMLTKRADMSIMDEKDEEFMEDETQKSDPATVDHDEDIVDLVMESTLSFSNSTVISEEIKTPRPTPTPRPLGAHRQSEACKVKKDKELVSILKAQIVAGGIRRDEDRVLKQERFERDNKRHERFII